MRLRAESPDVLVVTVGGAAVRMTALAKKVLLARMMLSARILAALLVAVAGTRSLNKCRNRTVRP